MNYNDEQEHPCTNTNSNDFYNNSNFEHAGRIGFRDGERTGDDGNPILFDNSNEGDFEETNIDNDTIEFAINSVVDDILDQPESYTSLQDDNNCTTMGNMTFNDEVVGEVNISTSDPVISQKEQHQTVCRSSFQMQTAEILTTQTTLTTDVTVDSVVVTMQNKADLPVNDVTVTDVTFNENRHDQNSVVKKSKEYEMPTAVEALLVQVPIESAMIELATTSAKEKESTVEQPQQPRDEKIQSDPSGDGVAYAKVGATIPKGDDLVDEGIDSVMEKGDDGKVHKSNEQESHDKSPVPLPGTLSKTEKNIKSDCFKISSIGTQMAQDYIDFATNFMLRPLSSQLRPMSPPCHPRSTKNNFDNAMGRQHSSTTSYCGNSSGFYYGFQTDGTHYPLEAISVLGYLKSPYRRPTVLERWSPYEIALFEGSIALYGKDFGKIANEIIRTKSTMQVIEFYYVWKKTSHYRLWKNSYVPPNMQDDDDSEAENNCTTVNLANNRKRKQTTDEYQSDYVQPNKKKEIGND